MLVKRSEDVNIFFFKVALSSAEVSFVLLYCFVRNGGRGPGEGEKTAARGGMPGRGKREERLFPSTHRSPRALPLFKNFPQGASAEERVKVESRGSLFCLSCSLHHAPEVL